MNETVLIPDAYWYWNKYGKDAIIDRNADRIFTKKQLVDAFHKEIFNLVAMRSKKKFDGQIPPEGDPEALAIVANVVKETTRKWIKVVKIFESHPRTRGLLTVDDLRIESEEEKDIPVEGTVSEPMEDESEAAQVTDEPIIINGGVKIGEEVSEEASND